MFKSLFLSAAMVVGLQGVVQASSESLTQEPAVASFQAAHGHVSVYFRKCEHEPWQKQGCYDCIHDAQDAARSLQAQGLLVMIR